jgi:hypothetical protein
VISKKRKDFFPPQKNCKAIKILNIKIIPFFFFFFKNSQKRGENFVPQKISLGFFARNIISTKGIILSNFPFYFKK